MIAKITKGRGAAAALRYDFGPGKREEHADPRIVAGNIPGSPGQIGSVIDLHNARRSELAKPIWRCALRTAPEDRVLDDTEWAQIAERYVGAMGYADCPWVAVRHGEEHIHLTISRLDWRGTLITDWFDYDRSRPVVRRLEREHALVNAELRSDRTAPQVLWRERAASARRGATRPERERVRELTRAARDTAAGSGRAVFERALDASGVLWRAHIAQSGRMCGYAFSVEGWCDRAGKQLWIPASKVAKDLRWRQLGSVLGEAQDGAGAVTDRIPGELL